VRALTRTQTFAHAITARTIHGHVRARRWQRVHPGVYASFTGPLPFHSRVWAALLYAGPDAMASHETAARLWGLAPVGSLQTTEVIHVTIGSNRRVVPQPGLRIHLSGRAEEARHPVALPPRTRVEETVLDQVTSAASLDDAFAVLTRACQRRLTTAGRLLDAASRRKKLRWRQTLERALADVDEGRHSPLELRYLRRVERAHGLPRGRPQWGWRHGRGQRWTDVRYERFRTRVELDGRIGHEEDGRLRDMRRDNAGTVAGDGTLRYGWADVEGSACEVAAQVAQVLCARGWTGGAPQLWPGLLATLHDREGYAPESVLDPS
jgi:hypothetical protein